MNIWGALSLLWIEKILISFCEKYQIKGHTYFASNKIYYKP